MKGLYMKVSDILADIATVEQQQREILLITKGHYTKELSNPATYVSCKYQATENLILAKHKMSVHEVVKYPCRDYSHQATTNQDLANHQRIVHEGVVYHCRQRGRQLSSKSNLARLKHSVHEQVKYSCSQCKHQATSNSSLVCHQMSTNKKLQLSPLTKSTLVGHKKSGHERTNRKALSLFGVELLVIHDHK